MNTMERRYSVPPSTLSDPSGRYRTTEDLHAWSIYRQNLNSDFTDNALGEKFIEIVKLVSTNCSESAASWLLC